MSALRRPMAHHPFVQAVARALRGRCGVGEGSRLVVAVSGGCDSLALLRALACLAPRRRWQLKLVVGHVQHHLRPQAEAEAAFVADLASRLDLPMLRRDIDVSRSGNLEAHARRERYAALKQVAAAFEAHAVVTAHHADDQLETLLMRLMRGASLRGMAGMAWRRPLDAAGTMLLRPMLAVDRAAAAAFLRDIHQTWCEDHTNLDVSRQRARLRHEVTPILRAMSPRVAARSVQLGEHLRAASALIDSAVMQANVQAANPIARAWARDLPRLVLGGLLRHRLRELGVSQDRLTARTLNPLLRAIRDHRGGSRQFHIAGGVDVLVDAEFVRLSESKVQGPKSP